MSSEDYMKISVGGHQVGIIGLREALRETAEKMTGKSQMEIAEALLESLSKSNYIVEKSRSLYRDAFLREYKKVIGEPVDEAVSAGLDVKVLGEGCARCNQLEQDMMAVMSETGIAGALDHVTDIKEISRYGVMGTPALVINGKVVSVGKVPSKSKLKILLMEARSKQHQ